MYAYNVAQGLEYVLKAAVDNLTRDNIMKQAAGIRDLELGGLLPGVKVNTFADRLRPDFAVATDEVQGRHLGTLRRNSSAATSAVNARNGLPKKQPLGFAAGAFCCETSGKMIDDSCEKSFIQEGPTVNIIK